MGFRARRVLILIEKGEEETLGKRKYYYCRDGIINVKYVKSSRKS